MNQLPPDNVIILTINQSFQINWSNFENIRYNKENSRRGDDRMKSLMIKWRKWRESKYLPLIIILLTSISMFLLVKGSVQENTYDISLMNLAPETIRSVKTMEDPIKTEEEKDQAASEVNPVYQFQDETAENQATIIESIFDSVIEIKQSITSDEPEAATDSLQRLKKK